MTATLEKTNRNNQPIKKRLRSNVEDFEDIVWKRDTGNPIIDNAIEHDEFTFSIKFYNKKYDIKAPKRRTIKRFTRYAMKEKDGSISEIEKLEMADVQENLIENMIDGLIVDDIDMDDDEYDQLGMFCWKYYEYSKKKLAIQAKDYI